MVTRSKKRCRSKTNCISSRCKDNDGGALRAATAAAAAELLQERGTMITNITAGRYYHSRPRPCSRDWKRCLRARARLRRILGLISWMMWVQRITLVGSMRIPRPWSEESACEMALDPDWPFVYSKYREQEVYHYPSTHSTHHCY